MKLNMKVFKVTLIAILMGLVLTGVGFVLKDNKAKADSSFTTRIDCDSIAPGESHYKSAEFLTNGSTNYVRVDIKTVGRLGYYMNIVEDVKDHMDALVVFDPDFETRDLPGLGSVGVAQKWKVLENIDKTRRYVPQKKTFYVSPDAHKGGSAFHVRGFRIEVIKDVNWEILCGDHIDITFTPTNIPRVN